MSFEKKMAAFDKALFEAKTDLEKEDVLRQLADELDGELKARGMDEHERFAKVNEILTDIRTMMREDEEAARDKKPTTGELDT